MGDWIIDWSKCAVPTCERPRTGCSYCDEHTEYFYSKPSDLWSGKAAPHYLCLFVHRLLEFRIPELQAIADYTGTTFSYLPKDTEALVEAPFLPVTLASDDVAQKLASRSLLTRAFFEVWGCGRTYDEVKDAVAAYPEERKAPYLTENTTFKFVVDAYGASFSTEEQLQRIDLMKDPRFPFKGRVTLKNPEHTFYILEDVGVDNSGTRHLGEDHEVVPRRIYFGRLIAEGQRGLAIKYTLKKRRFICSTSMDAELALLVANQALIRPSDLVLDPFVGTGSIAVACGHFGGRVIGGDIDIRVLRGKGEGRTICDNFDQYKLPTPDLVRCDNSRPCWRQGTIYFDAIACDPPYGIRAGGRKTGSRKANPLPIPKEKKQDHIPSTIPYAMTEVLIDLYDLACRYLKVGGRLVYWFPATPEYTDDELPTHECFELLANSEQRLTSSFSRRLVTVVKTKAWKESMPRAVILAGENASYVDIAAKVFKDDNRKDGRVEKKLKEKEEVKEAELAAASKDAEGV